MGWRDRRRSGRRSIFSLTLKGLRELRGLGGWELAARMGLEPRSYQRFESGDVRIELERLVKLAEVADSDPIAILSAVLLERPELATQCADNKLMLIAAQGLERLSRRHGDRIQGLETATIIAAFDLAFDSMDAELVQRGTPRED